IQLVNCSGCFGELSLVRWHKHRQGSIRVKAIKRVARVQPPGAGDVEFAVLLAVDRHAHKGRQEWEKEHASHLILLKTVSDLDSCSYRHCRASLRTKAVSAACLPAQIKRRIRVALATLILSRIQFRWARAWVLPSDSCGSLRLASPLGG